MKAKKSAWTRLKGLIYQERKFYDCGAQPPPAAVEKVISAGEGACDPCKVFMIAKRYIVRGRVQGVGFRWFVDHEARSLGLAGWVRNNIDGTVEALAMGTDQQHAAFAGKLRQGPRAARVDEVTELPAEPVEGLTTFRIEGAW